MLKTDVRELICAAVGAVIGCGLPIILHFLLVPSGYDEVWGLPIVFLCLPGLFMGAIAAVKLNAWARRS